MKDKNKRRYSIILSSFLCGFLLFTGTMFKIKTDDGDGESEYFDAGKKKTNKKKKSAANMSRPRL